MSRELEKAANAPQQRSRKRPARYLDSDSNSKPNKKARKVAPAIRQNIQIGRRLAPEQNNADIASRPQEPRVNVESEKHVQLTHQATTLRMNAQRNAHEPSTSTIVKQMVSTIQARSICPLLAIMTKMTNAMMSI